MGSFLVVEGPAAPEAATKPGEMIMMWLELHQYMFTVHTHNATSTSALSCGFLFSCSGTLQAKNTALRQTLVPSVVLKKNKIKDYY